MNGDVSDRYLRFRPYDESLGFSYTNDQWFNDVSATRRIYLEQGELMGGLYKKALTVDKEYAEYLYGLWVSGLDDTQNLLTVMGALAYQIPFPSPEHPAPPTETGIVCELPGPFFMSGKPTSRGLWIGTYRPAKLYLFDGQFHEKASGPWESVYMIDELPNGKIIFTTECPAGIGLEQEDGTFNWTQLRPEPLSLAFDIWQGYRGGLIVNTTSNSNRTDMRTYRGSIDGKTWLAHRDHSGFYMPCYCTDGDTYYVGGRKADYNHEYPYVMREDGTQIIWMKDYEDDEINYMSVKDGLFTFGLNYKHDIIYKDPTKPRRNGYVMYGTTSGMYHSGIDLVAPWIMQTDIFVNGRYAIASVWNETGYPNPELVKSTNGTDWTKILSVPFPSVQTMDIGKEGIYLFGGAFAQYGKVYLLKM